MSNDDLLNTIETLLFAHVPEAVADARILEPVYCLRIWYHGSDTWGSDRTPGLMLPKESWRLHVLSEKGSEAAHYLWCADEMDTGDKSLWAKIENGLIIESCRMWYRLRYADPDDGMTQQEALRPFREMLQRACGRLNLLDWKGIAAVTEDFVVFPADWSHMFCDDYGDMLASVPAAKIEVLRRRSVIEI